MKKSIIKKLSAFFKENPTLLGVAATYEEIENAEKELHLTIDNDYKEFILNFGGREFNKQVQIYLICS